VASHPLEPPWLSGPLPSQAVAVDEKHKRRLTLLSLFLSGVAVEPRSV
jgi:hypothetical protein